MLLRKTVAERVAPVFVRIVEQWPTPDALLSADEIELAEQIHPLGLFRVRSRALKAAALRITQEHRGLVPRSFADIVSLPHCGRYVANAVLCFSFGEPRGLVDGNIARLFLRHFGMPVPVEIHKSESHWSFSESLVPADAPRAFNYALLDYCAVVCRPRLSLCDVNGLPALGICR